MNLLNIRSNVIDRFKKAYHEINNFNKVEKSYFLAQLLYVAGFSIVPTLLPLVINTLTGETASIGVLSATSSWAIMLMTFFAGNIVKLFSMRKLLIAQSFIQVFIYAAIAILLFTKVLTIPLLLVCLIMSGIILTLSSLLEIDRAGSNRIFSSAHKKETALYIFNLVSYISMLTLPIIFGVFIDFIGKYIGVELALAMAYALFCAIVLICALLYIKDVYPATDYIISTNKKNISRKTMLFKTHKNMWNAAKIIVNNDALRLRFVLASVESFVYTPISIVVLPTLAIDILHRGATGNGLLLGAINAGAMLATLLLLNGKRLQKKYGFYRYIFWLALLSSLAFVPSIVFWAYPFLWVAIPAAMCIQFLLEPLRGRVELLVQLEINGDEKAKLEEPNIFNLFGIVSGIGSSIGCFILGLIFLHSGPGTVLYTLVGTYAPLKIVTLFMGIYGIVNIAGIIWFKRHVYHTYPLGYISEAQEMTELEHTLQHEHLHQPLHETFHNPIAQTRPTIVLLASGTDDHISQARANRTQYSRDIHLVLDSAWILEALQEDGTNRLYLKKGLYFDREGDPILAEYKIPRLIHYFANFYSPIDPLNKAVLNLENRLDTPVPTSSRLQHLINESLLMRLWLSSRGTVAPITCAFLMPEHTLIDTLTPDLNTPQLDTFAVAFPLYTGESAKKEFIKKYITLFLTLYDGNELVIKPSGTGIVLPEGIAFFKTTAIDEMIKHIIMLSQHPLMTSTSAILIEECLHPPALFLDYKKNDRSGRYCIIDKVTPLYILTPEEIYKAHNAVKKEWVVHVLAARSPWGQCLITGIIVRADSYGQPLSKYAAIIPFESIITALRIQHGLLNSDDDVWLLEKKFEQLAAQVLLTIDEEQKKSPVIANDPLQVQVDYFGLDLILLSIDGVLTPKVIAFHDHTVGRQYQFDLVYPEQLGEHSKVWFATMFNRARQSACKGKRLILVGAGNETRQPFIDTAIKLGIEIILLDHKNSWARNLVGEFIVIDNNQATANEQALQDIARSIQSFGPIDGITTYCDTYIVFTAELARDLELPYLSVSNARTTTNNLKTQTTLSAADLAVPLFFHVEDENTLEMALHQINRIEHNTGTSHFPMIVKPLFESKRVRAKKADTPNDIRDFFHTLHFHSHKVHGFMIEEFIEGKEFFVDIIMQGGKVKYSSIADNVSKLAGNSMLPAFKALPCTELETQQQQACINLATLTLHTLEITDGIMHIKGKYEFKNKGAYILEIQPYPADWYLSLWQKDVWGVDIIELFFALALEIPIHTYTAEAPLTYLHAYDFTTNETGVFQGWTGIETLDQCPGFRTFQSLIDIGTTLKTDNLKFSFLGYVIAEGNDQKNAAENLKNLLSKIDFKIEKKSEHKD